jgi:heavy metal sensor kinase
VIRVARLTNQTESLLGNFFFLMMLGIPLIVVVSALAGYFLSKRALSPIVEIVEKAKHISAESLSDRIPVQNEKDELGELTTTFNKMFSRLDLSFQQMRRFTSDAAHELRTPLAAIRAMGEVALRREPGRAECAETLGNILEETTRLQNLCEGLLTLAKAEAGNLSLRKEPTDLKSFLESVLQTIGVLAEEKGITVAVRVPQEAAISVDPMWLRQAVLNVIDNGIKYTPKGGEILVTAEAANGRMVIRIKDSGPGISKDHTDRIFDRFYRADSGRDRSIGGAGLGLAIAKGIVESHGGTISIQSSRGQGTEVGISLPSEGERV